MKLTKLTLPLAILLCLMNTACSEDELLITDVDLEPTPFMPEIIQSSCYSEGTSYELMQVEDDRYFASWIHDGNPIGHDTRTNCLCDGTLEVKITRESDGATTWKSMEISKCTTEIK